MPNYRNVTNILLDLDNTLICAVEKYELDNSTRELESIKYNSLKKHNLANKYIIFERPYLKEFLKYIFSNFNVSIWTAASDDYMEFIVRNIIKKYEPHGIIINKFHSDHCKISERYSHNNSTKSIKLLCDKPELFGIRNSNYKMDNTFIIDDYYEIVIAKNIKNSIHVKNFEYIHKNSHNDIFLKKMLDFFQLNKNLLNVNINYFHLFIEKSKKLLSSSPISKGSGRLGIKLSREQRKNSSPIKKINKKSPNKKSPIKKPIKSRNKLVRSRNTKKIISPQIKRQLNYKNTKRSRR